MSILSNKLGRQPQSVTINLLEGPCWVACHIGLLRLGRGPVESQNDINAACESDTDGIQNISSPGLGVAGSGEHRHEVSGTGHVPACPPDGSQRGAMTGKPGPPPNLCPVC